MNIYERVQYLAKQNGTTIKTLEKELGIGNGTIKGWERSSPRCDKIILIANHFKVSIEWLIVGTESTVEHLTETEYTVLNEYRNAKPEVQQSARLLLRAGKEDKGKSSNYKIG